jgi:peptide deformylase
VPGEHFPTNRAEQATVTGTDADGEPLTIVGTGLLAVCLQHETDHLDGLLYLDRLTGRYKREARRMLKANGWRDGTPYSWQPGLDPDPFGH